MAILYNEHLTIFTLHNPDNQGLHTVGKPLILLIQAIHKTLSMVPLRARLQLSHGWGRGEGDVFPKSKAGGVITLRAGGHQHQGVRPPVCFKRVTGGALPTTDATLAIETRATNVHFTLVGPCYFLEEYLRDVTNSGELAG